MTDRQKEAIKLLNTLKLLLVHNFYNGYYSRHPDICEIVQEAFDDSFSCAGMDGFIDELSEAVYYTNINDNTYCVCFNPILDDCEYPMTIDERKTAARLEDVIRVNYPRLMRVSARESAKHLFDSNSNLYKDSMGFGGGSTTDSEDGVAKVKQQEPQQAERGILKQGSEDKTSEIEKSQKTVQMEDTQQAEQDKAMQKDVEYAKGHFRMKYKGAFADCNKFFEKLITIRPKEFKGYYEMSVRRFGYSLKEFFDDCERIVPNRKHEKGWNYNNIKK